MQFAFLSALLVLLNIEVPKSTAVEGQKCFNLT
jgi:hypothetical protein